MNRVGDRPRVSLRWIVAGLVVLIALAGAVEYRRLFPGLMFAIQRSPELLPSSTLIPEREIASGNTVLSLYVEDRHLRDPDTGLLTHTMARGPEWQRPAFVSYFDRGELIFAAQAGIRVHGGKSRQNSPVQSFRLHFEKRYGANQFRPGVLFGPATEPLRRLVVHNDLRQDLNRRWWHFVNPLAYDIARRVGALAPETRPARVFLNGEPLGAYVLAEHVPSRAFLQSHFGHRNFTQADAQTRDRLRREFRRQPALTAASVGTIVDLENLTRWFIAMLFCATTDSFQGVMLRDDTSSHARWFWVIWDMDHSFMDLYRQAPVPWEHDTFATLLRKPDVRSELVTRLLGEDPAYLDYFKRTLADALNHRLSPDFLAERFEYYGGVARALRVPDTEYLLDPQRLPEAASGGVADARRETSCRRRKLSLLCDDACRYQGEHRRPSARRPVRGLVLQGPDNTGRRE